MERLDRIASHDGVVTAVKKGYVEVRIKNQHGDLCCVVTGLAYRKDATLPVDGLM